MEPKSVVMKSKSSNSAISKKKDKGHKFSRSDVEFQPLNTKKRGVYVDNKENNLQKTIAFENKVVEAKKKPPPRSRHGEKKFLTSVLTILSKSTTGTQYPDRTEPKSMIKKSSQNLKRFKTNSQINEVTFTNIESDKETKMKTKKPKYKSKILNTKKYGSDNDKFVILQSKKNICNTPSNYSEMSKNAIVDESRNPIRDLLENNVYSGVAQGIAKEVLEGKAFDKTFAVQEDPSTLVNDVQPKDDKKIYNFFVDLLETTFDVYNVNTDTIVNNNDSETVLEIDENVANKLNTRNESCCGKRHEHEINFDIREDEPLVSVSDYESNRLDKIKKSAKPRSIKGNSFMKSKSYIAPKPSEMLPRRKPMSKAAKKKNLLNTIKEELKMDFDCYEEPQSLYQVLRNMARYKRKCQAKKSLKFKDDNKNRNIDKECLFSRGSFSTKRLRKPRIKQEKPKIKNNLSEYRNRYIKKMHPKMTPSMSDHSLKVYGVEYESSDLPFENRHYVESVDSEIEIDPDAIIGISDSSLNMKQFYSLLRD